MDSRTRLDYALFQLTPTRTRCDLVIFSGTKTEKLAYGLLQPFVSHLKFAKDEISKGGYSITLRPPSSGDPSTWFTKATFERFVRFVSTPEILERFINLEKEILQIESSIRSNELEQSNATREGEQAADIGSVENDELVQEENSRIRLQRLLQTRKAMLLRSQAMAYARGRAAGFDMDNMDELIAFADAFGASRLREACVEFKEFFKKKQTDVPWMEELSAMEAFSTSELSFPASSGITLTNDLNYSNGVHLSSNGSSDPPTDVGSDGKKDDNVSTAGQIPPNKIQMQIPWPNQFPPYMYQMPPPPYQAYPYPVMQPPPYQQGGYQDPKWEKRYKKKKDRKPRQDDGEEEEDEEENDEDLEEDAETQSSDGKSDSDEKRPRDSTPKKKHKKKSSSRTVVIRNINYITSKGKDGDDEEEDSDNSSDEFIDGDSLKKKVESAVEALNKKNHHKSKKKKNTITGVIEQDSEDNSRHYKQVDDDSTTMVKSSWDAFQNILMRNEDSDSNLERSNEYNTASGEEHLSSFQGGVGNGKVGVQRKISDDSMIMTEWNGENGNLNGSSLDFDSRENSKMVLKRSEIADDALMMSGSFEVGQNNHPLDYGIDSSLTKTRRSGEDALVVVNGKSDHGDSNSSTRQIIFDGDYSVQSSGRKTWKEVPPMDDSFMIQALRQSSHDESDSSQWRSDISMVGEFMQENVTTVQEELRASKSYEPDDMCVILGRHDDDVDSNRLSWNNDFSMTEVVNKFGKDIEEKDKSADKIIKSSSEEKPKGGKPKAVNRPPLVKTRPEITSRVKKASPPVTRTAVQKSKLEKEEEMRKRMEELVIERQRRIAERSAATAGVATAVKKSPSMKSKPAGTVRR